MASQPIPQESARVILAIFKVMGFHSGAILQKDQVQLQFTVNGGNAADFSATPIRRGSRMVRAADHADSQADGRRLCQSKAADHSD